MLIRAHPGIGHCGVYGGTLSIMFFGGNMHPLLSELINFDIDVCTIVHISFYAQYSEKEVEKPTDGFYQQVVLRMIINTKSAHG